MKTICTDMVPENDYLLLTPGPLSTTKSVRAVMLKDWCTWDEEYCNLVQEVRERLLTIATKQKDLYTTVLMQGSGTFSVESTIGSAISKQDKLLVLDNGAYGRRICKMAEYLHIPCVACHFHDTEAIDLNRVEEILENDPEITHVAVIHCETTTGILNPIDRIGKLVKKYHKVYIVDAMSSFGGVPFDVAELDIDFLISSANKCIQGVPGFGFIVAKKDALMQCQGNAKSLSLDLYDQWDTMEKSKGKWRFTSPTHVVRAFYQALLELEAEGGVEKRWERYSNNQKTLVAKMGEMNLKPLLDSEVQSPIITTFLCPENSEFQFDKFYRILKKKGFVIYPGKLTEIDTFRIGNIGDICEKDMIQLVEVIQENKFW